MADYLRRARPAAALDRAVFIRVKAPHRSLTPTRVTKLVYAASRRAGLDPAGAHRLRHSAATTMHASYDITVIALLLGHENITTTGIYLQADLALEERALARTTPIGTTPGRYQPPTPFWSSLRACNHADVPGPAAAPTSTNARDVGIITTSA